MTLCVDIGNTRTTFAIVENGIVIASAHESSRHIAFKKAQQAVHRLCDNENAGEISTAGIASVVPYLTTLVANAIKDATGCEPFLVTAASSGIETAYDHSESLGADRLCNAAAAFRMASGSAIVIDCGTAATIDCISASGKFLGGAIMSGYRTTARALAGITAQLPEIPFVVPSNALGTSTDLCMQSGIFLGTTYAIEGIVRKIIAEAYQSASPILIVTGGHYDVFCGITSLDVHPAPDLVLQGIEILTERSRAAVTAK